VEPVPPRELSFRERQIVELIQQAKANKEIAFELSLTEGTIKEYLYHIFRKLGVRNRTDLALWARNHIVVEHGPGANNAALSQSRIALQ
jgi:DNA-binding NarL/FixJ family response regulator